MNTLTIDQTLFTGNPITEEGIYLWKNSSGIEMIEVYRVPAKKEYGLSWDSYLAVKGHRGRSVEHLVGQFMKVEFK